MKKLRLYIKQFNVKSVKKYRIDIFVAAIVIIGGVFFAQKPDIDAKIQQAKNKGNLGAPVAKMEPKKKEPLPVETADGPQPTSYKNIDNRNIFSPSGGYETTKELKHIPENPYNLIATLQGKEKRVILREFTGDLVSVKVGSTLIDGGTVKQIGEKTVTIVKGNQVRELKMFDVKAAGVGVVSPVVKGATESKGVTDTKAASDTKTLTKKKGNK